MTKESDSQNQIQQSPSMVLCNSCKSVAHKKLQMAVKMSPDLNTSREQHAQRQNMFMRKSAQNSEKLAIGRQNFANTAESEPAASWGGALKFPSRSTVYLDGNLRAPPRKFDLSPCRFDLSPCRLQQTLSSTTRRPDFEAPLNKPRKSSYSHWMPSS